MNRRSWFGMLTVLGALCAYGCPPANNNDVVDNDATDIGTDTGACADGFVPTDPTADSGTCYRATTCDNSPFCPSLVTNTASNPKFVIAQIDVQTPAVLAPTGAVGRLLNDSIAQGKFFWGITFDLTANTIRTGTLLTDMAAQPGAGYLTNNFHYLSGAAPGPNPNRWDPVTGPVTVSGDTVSSMVIPLITVPVYGNPTDGGAQSLLAELPLRNVSMHDVVLTSNRNCIGLAKYQFVSCLTNRWLTSAPADGGTGTPYGILEGDITVTDAESIILVDLGNRTLCSFIAGIQDNNCAARPQAEWPNQPETTTSGLGWHLRANFAGYAANIQ